MTSTDHPAAFKGRFTCVVDEDPRFHLDALRWYASLTEIAAVDPRDLVVNVVGTEHSDVLDYLRAAGVTVWSIDPFDPRSPHCNKIAGALRLAQDSEPGVAVLCDTDIVVLDDPRCMELPVDAVGGKVVDAPVPPLNVLLEVFRASGVPAPPSVPLPWGSGEQTVSGNSNGGLYLVPGSLLPRVAPAWAHWARWLLDRIGLLEEWSTYVDQVAMAVALAAERIDTAALAVRWNTPTHDPTRFPADPPSPSIIHYHQEVDRQGLIESTGRASIDSQIQRVNDAIRRVWDRAAPHVTHKRWLASTPRADGLESVVTTLVDALGANTVLDVGADSGIEWGARDVEVTGLEGVPDAQESLARCHLTADVVVCMELLTDRRDPDWSRKVLCQLWRSTTRALVVRGPHDSAGIADQPGEDLTGLLSEIAPDAELYPVTRGGVTAVIALRPASSRHPRDYGPTTLAPLVVRHPDPLALLLLRLHALGTTTFYPDHAPRLWEYPVVAQLVRDTLPRGSRLIDVGAGVTPLAPFLASDGYVLETVDPSPVVRRWPPQPDWNEWDFVDYGAVGLAHRSWNCALEKVPRKPLFDGAYSVSVIEHVPAAVRRRLLADIATRIRPGGLVVLTIDLVRDTDDLWNLNLGVVVEELSDHGTLDDVVAECALVGLELFRKDVVREWGDTRVDIGLVALRKVADPSPLVQGRPKRRWRDLIRFSGD